VNIELGLNKKVRRAYGIDEIALVPGNRTLDYDLTDPSWSIGDFKREVPIILKKLFKKTNYSSSKVDWLVLHQANLRILDSVGERLKIPREKILSNLEKYGNTSAATIPLMMDEAVRDYRIKQNDIIATSGFGAGLSWGAALFKWG